jgi:hypothetical protein
MGMIEPSTERHLQRDFLQASCVHQERYDFRKQKRLLQEWCDPTGVSCLDLLPILEESEPARLYFSTDLHWTATGHRVAAINLTPLIAVEFARLKRRTPSASILQNAND